jgi:hypothetical protein
MTATFSNGISIENIYNSSTQALNTKWTYHRYLCSLNGQYYSSAAQCSSSCYTKTNIYNYTISHLFTLDQYTCATNNSIYSSNNECVNSCYTQHQTNNFTINHAFSYDQFKCNLTDSLYTSNEQCATGCSEDKLLCTSNQSTGKEFVTIPCDDSSYSLPIQYGPTDSSNSLYLTIPLFIANKIGFSYLVLSGENVKGLNDFYAAELFSSIAFKLFSRKQQDPVKMPASNFSKSSDSAKIIFANGIIVDISNFMSRSNQFQFDGLITYSQFSCPLTNDKFYPSNSSCLASCGYERLVDESISYYVNSASECLDTFYTCPNTGSVYSDNNQCIQECASFSCPSDNTAYKTKIACDTACTDLTYADCTSPETERRFSLGLAKTDGPFGLTSVLDYVDTSSGSDVETRIASTEYGDEHDLPRDFRTSENLG